MFQAHNLEDFYTTHPDYTPTGTEQAVYISNSGLAILVHSSTHCKSDLYFTLHANNEGTATATDFHSLMPILDRDWFVGAKRAKSYGRNPYTEFTYDSTEGFPNHLTPATVHGTDTPTSVRLSHAFQQSAVAYAKKLDCLG